MNDLEISKALALAIGWPVEHVHTYTDGKVRCMRNVKQWSWQVFDYRDEVIAFRVAERYDCFPVIASCHGDDWHSMFGGSGPSTYADTPQKAIALAVIQGAKK